DASEPRSVQPRAQGKGGGGSSRRWAASRILRRGGVDWTNKWKVQPSGDERPGVRVAPRGSVRPPSAPMITEGEPAMHSSPARRAAKALTGLVVAAGFALAADRPGQAASTGEGETVKQVF